MAGYVRKLVGYVYDGAHVAAEELESGSFVTIEDVGGEFQVKLNAAKADLTLRCVEKTTLYGMPALVLDVVSGITDPVYFVEQVFDNNNGADWNEAEDKVKVGQLVRMKRLLPGEQIIMSVSDATYGGVDIGTPVNPAAGGTIAA